MDRGRTASSSGKSLFGCWSTASSFATRPSGSWRGASSTVRVPSARARSVSSTRRSPSGRARKASFCGRESSGRRRKASSRGRKLSGHERQVSSRRRRPSGCESPGSFSGRKRSEQGRKASSRGPKPAGRRRRRSSRGRRLSGRALESFGSDSGRNADHAASQLRGLGLKKGGNSPIGRIFAHFGRISAPILPVEPTMSPDCRLIARGCGFGTISGGCLQLYRWSNAVAVKPRTAAGPSQPGGAAWRVSQRR